MKQWWKNNPGTKRKDFHVCDWVVVDRQKKKKCCCLNWIANEWGLVRCFRDWSIVLLWEVA